MPLTMPSARLPCSAILSRLPRSISTTSSTAARSSLPSAATAGAVVSFSSCNSSPDSSAKLFTKLSGFLISCAIPAVNWPRAAIFCACSRLACARLQFLQRSLGGVARGADLGLGALPLGDVAVDQHNPATRHRVAAHLDDPAIRARPLVRPLRPDTLRQPTHFGLDVDRAVFAMRGEEANKIANTGPLG